MMKKIKTAAVLILILLLAAACAAGPEEETVPEYGSIPDDGNIDLQGYEFIMASAIAGSENPLNPQSGNTARGDRLLQRYRDTENKFNIKINVRDDCSCGELVIRSAAGLKYADLMAVKINDMVHGKYIQNGYFIPFSYMNIDLDSGIYGTQSIPPQIVDRKRDHGRFGDIPAVNAKRSYVLSDPGGGMAVCRLHDADLRRRIHERL